MIRNVLGLLVVFAALGGLPARAGSDLKPWTDGPAPQLSLRDLTGQPVNLADFRGKVVLVNFWATRCAPCIEELPSMQRVQDKLGRDGFKVLAVNYQEGRARIDDFLKKRPLKLTILRDHDGSARTGWGVRGFPTSFVIDTDQRIRYTVTGGVDWSSPKVESQIRELLIPQPRNAGKRIRVVLSGDNVDTAMFAEVLSVAAGLPCGVVMPPSGAAS
jgi:cytochrome c biogenesis protein CcmG, thiol:disulfide interchange protein DsbE